MSSFDEIQKEDCFVLVAEFDVKRADIGKAWAEDLKPRPIVWEQFLDDGAASKAHVEEFKKRLGSTYGRTRIAKLVFIDQEEE